MDWDEPHAFLALESVMNEDCRFRVRFCAPGRSMVTNGCSGSARLDADGLSGICAQTKG